MEYWYRPNNVFLGSCMQFDDDSGVISDAFIEAVAAIVLQTAIRRFLAIRLAGRLRTGPSTERHNTNLNVASQSVTPQPKKISTTEKDTVKNSEEVATNEPLKKPSPQTGQPEAALAAQESVDSDPMAQEDFFYDLAAIQIQSVFRGWWVRDSINVDH